MNTKILYGLALVGAVSMLSVARVEAATVFAPTDGDVNFLFDTFNEGTMLAMFDDSDTTLSGSHLDIPLPELVLITVGGTNPGDWTATNETPTPFNLTGSSQFRLGISTDAGVSWSGDISTSPAGTNALNVTFSDGTVLSVDVQVVPAIPVPAAVWLFGSGLIGLVGVARRKARAPGLSLS
jgi:hypothetical protein